MIQNITNRLKCREWCDGITLRQRNQPSVDAVLHQPLDFKLECCVLSQHMSIHVLEFLEFLQKVEVWPFGWASGTASVRPQNLLMLFLQDMILLAVIDDLLPHRMNVLFREVDTVIRQREMGRKISTLVFEIFLFCLELRNVAVRKFESVQNVGTITKLRDSVVRVGSQDSREVLVPLIISDPVGAG